MKTHVIVAAAAAAVLSFVAGDFAHRAEGADATEAQLRKMEDVVAIQSLLVHYGRELDKRDFKAYGALFAQDGSWKGGMGAAIGPDAIAKMVAAGFEKMSPALYQNSYHVMTSFDIDVKGDTATAWSRWTFVIPSADGKPVIGQSGRYSDTLVRENGHWKFKRREAMNDIPAGPPPSK